MEKSQEGPWAALEHKKETCADFQSDGSGWKEKKLRKMTDYYQTFSVRIKILS